MLTKAEKIEVVERFTDRFKRQRVSIFADFRGISVAKLETLRRELKKVSAEFKVVKKTLLKRAIEASGAGEIEPKGLEGEIGVIFGYEDQIAPAKAAAKFAKGNETFKVLRGILSGKVLEAKEVLALAKLPGREQLLAQLAYALNGPIQGLATVLQGNLQNLVVVLNRVKDKK